MQKKTYLAALAACAALALAGCGGGSGGSSNDLDGQWESPLYLYPINGYNGYNNYRLFVLNGGVLWGTLSSDNYTASTNIQSMVYGSYGTSYDNSSTCDYYDDDGYCTSWSSDDTEYFDTKYTQFNFVGTAPNAQLGFSGEIDGSSLNGRFSYGSPFTIKSGNYMHAVSLASIAGTYSGYVAISSSKTSYNLNGITISGSNLTLPANTNGCSASGTLTPHSPQASDGTVFAFDTSLTFHGAGCALGNGATVQGITYQTTLSDHATAIQILSVTDDKQTGFMMTAVR
jgi:hypothetical protein